MPRLFIITFSAGLFQALLGVLCVTAGTIALTPIADTALFELEPELNFGGQPDLPAGTLGTSGSLKRSRALFKFDVTAVLPTNAAIGSAALRLTVTKSPDGRANSTFGLHRVLKDWGEGGKIGAPPGGARATENEATWRARFFPDGLWSSPGGQGGVDYLELPSSTERVSGNGTYEFESGARTVQDVQDWSLNPGTNFGWILISQSEDIARSARRFATREDFPVTNRPTLIVEFTLKQRLKAPVITGFRRQGDQTLIRFTAQAGVAYSLQIVDALPNGIWTTIASLSPLSTDSESTFTNSPASGAQKFYRIRGTDQSL